MSKIIFIFIFTLSLLFSQDSQDFSFVGLSASTQKINIEPGGSLWEPSGSLWEPGGSSWEGGFGLKYGQQSLDMRTIFTLDYTHNSYYGASVEIDKILLDNMFGTPKLRPYLGAVVGYMRFDDDEVSRLYDDMNGFYLGGNFGFIIYAADTVDVDMSYHYYQVGNLDFLNDLHGATLAVHYFF